jgi:hypothetical protein
MTSSNSFSGKGRAYKTDWGGLAPIAKQLDPYWELLAGKAGQKNGLTDSHFDEMFYNLK